MDVRKQITDRIQAEFEQLKKRAEELHFGVVPVLNPETKKYSSAEDHAHQVTESEEILHGQQKNDDTSDIKKRIKTSQP